MGVMTGNISAGRPILAKVVNINTKERARMVEELANLMAEAQTGALIGISYAATSSRRQEVVGCAGSHSDSDKAIASLLRAATALSMLE